jgi:hypothetical protein
MRIIPSLWSLLSNVRLLPTAFHWCCRAPISPCCGTGWENRPRCGGALPAAAAAMAAANRGGMRPAPGCAPCAPWPPNKAKDGGKSGRADNRNFSISASWRRFAFALLFWNQILTCNGKEKQPRSLVDRLKVCITCGTVMSTIWLVFSILWCLFSITIHGVLGINSTVVLNPYPANVENILSSQ